MTSWMTLITGQPGVRTSTWRVRSADPHSTRITRHQHRLSCLMPLCVSSRQSFSSQNILKRLRLGSQYGPCMIPLLVFNCWETYACVSAMRFQMGYLRSTQQRREMVWVTVGPRDPHAGKWHETHRTGERRACL